MKLFIYIVVVFVVVVLYLKKMIMDSVLELIRLLCSMYMLVMMRWNGVNKRIIELFII